jgi:hypothetical protein
MLVIVPIHDPLWKRANYYERTTPHIQLFNEPLFNDPLSPPLSLSSPHSGGNPTISSQTHKFMGIRNGIDPDLWDPENNQWLPMPFSSKNVVEGKAAARKVRERECVCVRGRGRGRDGGREGIALRSHVEPSLPPRISSF